MSNRALLALPLMLFAAPAWAQDAPACTAATATPSTIAALTTDTPAAGPGDCVTVEGWQTGQTLYADGDARYRPERIYHDPSSTGAIIGLIQSEALAPAPQIVRVTGRLIDCDAAAAVPPPSPRRQGGEVIGSTDDSYCGRFHGLALHVTAIETLGPASLVRRPAGNNPDRIGNLAPLAEGDGRRQAQAAAERLLTAIRARDVATIRALHGGAPRHRSADELAEAEALLLTDASSPFAALHGATPVAIALFGWKPPLWADATWRAESGRNPVSESIACYSVRADAAALWPIDSRDADNRPGRPYACTRILINGADGTVRFDTEQARDGAAEPG